jgi:chromosome segregation ATPase
MEVVMAKAIAAFVGLVLLSGAVVGLTPSAAEEEIGIVRERASNLPHDEALRLLGETLGRSIEATQSDPSIPDILNALDANIAATRRLRELVDGDTPVTERQMAEIAREITTIAKSFGAIAALAPGVFQRRLAQLGNIDAIGQEVGFRIADAKARIEALRRNNAEIDASVRSETLTRAEIEKLRLTRQANDAEMHSLEAAVAAWTYFSERHADVVTRLGDQSANLDVFFHALKENARVYDSAARTLNMANSLNLALSTLGSVEDLDSLRSDLVKSWTDLMKIVDEVNDGLMLQPGM